MRVITIIGLSKPQIDIKVSQKDGIQFASGYVIHCICYNFLQYILKFTQ